MSGMFGLCDGLTALNLNGFNTSKVKDMHHMFFCCSSLTTLDLPSVTSIKKYALEKCTNLTTLILRSNTLCTLEYVNAFNNTAIKNGTGYIYVPDNLVDTYKSATNWTTYANQIKGISELGG
jgi:surface protein